MTSKMLLSMAEAAKELGWSTERTRKWLQQTYCVIAIGDRFYTTPELLKQSAIPLDGPRALSMPQAAAILGWTTKKTRGWLRHMGATVKIGGRYYVTHEKLKSLLRQH